MMEAHRDHLQPRSLEWSLGVIVSPRGRRSLGNQVAAYSSQEEAGLQGQTGLIWAWASLRRPGALDPTCQRLQGSCLPAPKQNRAGAPQPQSCRSAQRMKL